MACSRCGAATTFPPPDEDELDTAYGHTYRPPAGRFAGDMDRILRRSRGLLAHRVARRAPPGPVLDVGAGDGALLDALRATGREAVGLERDSPRDDVESRDLLDVIERPGTWAAVVLWHALEHLREPGRALDHACELLASGGILILAVPNRDSWQARVFGDRWFALDLPRHLVHLPERALVDRLGAAGMRVERVSHWRGGQVVFGWLAGFVSCLPGDLDLYAAIRTPAARERPMSVVRRAAALGAAMMLLPCAVLLSAAEVLAGAGGTVMIEARRP